MNWQCLVRPACVLALCALAWGQGAAAATAAPPRGEWVFDVLLDGKPIGEHRFTVAGDATAATVRSVARFDVKFLFINAYRYQHQATEQWRGDCLSSLTARTDDNGDISTVDATMLPANDGLEVRTGKATNTLAGCVMSFAYWNPAMLQQRRLLNAQTGQYQAVQVEALPDEAVQARGQSVMARRYRLTGPENPLQLWYSRTGEWLALESTVSGGKRLRYQLRP